MTQDEMMGPISFLENNYAQVGVEGLTLVG
jgi:hypothetical protein